ncbi:MAG: histidine phosphatase family protein [Candidatus Odinarchaeota archaeon]
MTVLPPTRIKSSTYRILLIRHGQSEVYGRPWKSKDLPLSKLGIKQAQATSDILKKEPVNAFFTSPMKRARQTAEIIANPHNLDVYPIDGFSEIDTGIFTGKTNSEVIEHGENFKDIIVKSRDGPFVAQLLDYYPGLSFPGGESVGQMVNRVIDAWEILLEVIITNDYRITAIVSHAGTQTVILRHLSSYFFTKNLKKEKFDNTSITEIEMSYDGNYRIIRINDTSHIQSF